MPREAPRPAMILVGATMAADSPWRSAKGCTAILRAWPTAPRQLRLFPSAVQPSMLDVIANVMSGHGCSHTPNVCSQMTQV